MDILVDDQREYYGAQIVCRTYEAAQAVLPYVHADILYLDFDLGGVGNGAMLLAWIAYAYPLMRPTSVKVVSTLPEGIKKIEAELHKIGYVFDGHSDRWFRT
jgi:hypothetical protein